MTASTEYADLARRALTHVRNNTTDQAPGTMSVPIATYLDPQRYAHEIEHVFRRLPLGLALTLELAKPRQYVAMTVVGTPVIIVRADDGKVRAFLNVCRHRGAAVCDEGKGTAARFLCKYHAWRYDLTGRLTGVTDPSKFGAFDTAANGLVELPCVEHVGIVWVCLTPGRTFDIAAWLCGFGPQLASLDLENWYVYEQRDVPGPGWKVTWDGYLEAYHHSVVHATTLAAHTVGNLLVHDTWGPHQRLTLARQTIAALQSPPATETEAQQHVRLIHSVFPNMSLSGILGDHCLVSQVFPGPTPDTTTTRQTVLAAREPRTDEEKAKAQAFSALALQAVRDEDYKVGAQIQRGLKSGANEVFVLGRNEPAIQHYHEWVARYSSVG